jgi:hypothetical protein
LSFPPTGLLRHVAEVARTADLIEAPALRGRVLNRDEADLEPAAKLWNNSTNDDAEFRNCNGQLVQTFDDGQ